MTDKNVMGHYFEDALNMRIGDFAAASAHICITGESLGINVREKSHEVVMELHDTLLKKSPTKREYLVGLLETITLFAPLALETVDKAATLGEAMDILEEEQ